jgi:hypothetical protein
MASASFSGVPGSPCAWPPISSCSLTRTGTMVASGASPRNGTPSTGPAAITLATPVP